MGVPMTNPTCAQPPPSPPAPSTASPALPTLPACAISFALLSHDDLGLIVHSSIQLQSCRLHPVFGLIGSHGSGGVAFAGGRHGKDREDVGVGTTSDFSYKMPNLNSDKGGRLHIVFHN